MKLSFSIRELLLVVAFSALLLAGITYGAPVSWIALGLFIALWLTRLIDCFTTSGLRRNTAIAFSVCALAYLPLCFYFGESEFTAVHARDTKLPSSRWIGAFMNPVYEPGKSSREIYTTRIENGKSVFPLGHLAIACGLGYLGGWYVRLTTRNEPADTGAG